MHALGVSLLEQGLKTDEAVDALTKAGGETTKALIVAAQAEYQRGNRMQSRSKRFEIRRSN